MKDLRKGKLFLGETNPNITDSCGFGDSGSAARFFASFPQDEPTAKRVIYCPKADGDSRLGSSHPTVKPLALMRYLVRLITPPGGTVLDCFAGTGTTGEAAFREGFKAVLIERDAEYIKDVEKRMSLINSGIGERRRETVKKRGHLETVDSLPLFGGDA
jgi:site-specific DNA-methyltransferase (adenine-specific)